MFWKKKKTDEGRKELTKKDVNNIMAKFPKRSDRKVISKFIDLVEKAEKELNGEA